MQTAFVFNSAFVYILHRKNGLMRNILIKRIYIMFVISDTDFFFLFNWILKNFSKKKIIIFMMEKKNENAFDDYTNRGTFPRWMSVKAMTIWGPVEIQSRNRIPKHCHLCHSFRWNCLWCSNEKSSTCVECPFYSRVCPRVRLFLAFIVVIVT